MGHRHKDGRNISVSNQLYFFSFPVRFKRNYEKRVTQMEKQMRRLKGIITENETTQEIVAKRIGKHLNTINTKLKMGGGEFTANEIRLMKELLNMTNEEVFTVFLS